MISFIIIGRNEEKKLEKCFKSICKAVSFCQISEFETIYVDSNSSDNSVKLAKNFTDLEIKVFKILKNFNSAAARNIGASNSKAEVLFFIDGDMEIDPEFLKVVLNDDLSLKYDYVSGQLVNNFYDRENNFLGKDVAYKNLTVDRIEKTTGGVFLLKRKLWFEVGGMKNKYFKSQDLDLGFRLAWHKNVFLLRKKEVIAEHNTLSYWDKDRIKTQFKDYKILLFKGVLIRDHIFNKHIYTRIFRMDFTLILLILCVFASVLVSKFAILVYLSVIFLRTVFNFLKGKKDIFHIFSYFIFRDVAAICGMLFFYPLSRKPEFIEVL